jgi:UDP-N-acetylmuramyl pentapeptide synthase
MTAAVLGRLQRPSNSGNLNTETGVPLTMLGPEPHNGRARDGPAAPGRHPPIGRARPACIGIVTNIGVVHIEFFASQDELARAGRAWSPASESGLAVLNADDKYFEL